MPHSVSTWTCTLSQKGRRGSCTLVPPGTGAVFICSASLLKWDGAPPNSALSNTKNRSVLERPAMPIKETPQMLIHGARGHVPQPKHNDTGQFSLTGRNQFTEIEIAHQQNSLLDLGPCQNIGVLSLLVPPKTMR